MSRKGAKSGTRSRKLRSTGTKAGTRTAHVGEPPTELERKLAEALEREAATAEVLRVISSSPGDLQPVFETILAHATRICGAKFGVLALCEGDAFRHVAGHGTPPSFVEATQREPLIRPGLNTPLRRLAETKQVVHVVESLGLSPSSISRVLGLLSMSRCSMRMS